MKIKATVDKYCYTSKPTDSDAKKMRMRLPQEENYYDMKNYRRLRRRTRSSFSPCNL